MANAPSLVPRKTGLVMAGLLLAVLLLFAPHPGMAKSSSKNPVRVAVTAASPEISDQIAAELSHDPQLALVERAQLDTLLQEGLLSRAAGNADTRIQLGRLLAVDVFVYINTPKQGKWRIDIVHGTTGELLTSESCPSDIPKVVETARTLLKTMRLPNAQEHPRIAVIDFTVSPESKDADEGASGGRLAAELRMRLKENNFDVLDRLSIAQTVGEQILAESGFTTLTGKPLPLFGANFVVTGRWSATEKSLRLSVLDVAEGRLVREETFGLAPKVGAPEISEPVMKWVLEVVAGKGAAQKFEWTRSAKVEALEPFYRGVAMFHRGAFLDAAAEFCKAYELDDNLVTAYSWEARCYEAAGLQPLADAVRWHIFRYLEGYNENRNSTRAKPVEGTAFLGVESPAGNEMICRKLEILTTDAAAKTSQRLLLPAHLASLRDEYDVLVGVKNSRGITWKEAPGFLTRQTLSGVFVPSGERPVLRFMVNDTMQGSLLASEYLTLTGKSETWQNQIENTIRSLLSRSSVASAEQVPMAPLPSADELKARLRIDGNTAVLKLALKDPATLVESGPILVKRSWYYEGALNFGLRQYLLAALPSTDPLRPWLELQQIDGWLPYFDLNRTIFSDQKVDGIAELERFTREHPSDLAGAVAEYMLLWDTMAHLPYPELEKRFATLVQRLSETSDIKVYNLSRLKDFAEHMRQLAIIAQDDPTRRIPLPQKDFPVRMTLKFDKNGRILVVHSSWWEANEWQHFQVSPQDAVHEARAAFAFLGRGRNTFKVDPAWLHDFPHSHALVCFVIECLRKADMDDGLPLKHPFDASAERADYRAMATYLFQEIHREIQNASNARELDQLESYEIRRFLTALVHTGYSTTVTDAEFETMQRALANNVADAAQRLGRTQRQNYQSVWLDWREIRRATSPFLDPKNWRENLEAIYDDEAMKQQARAAAASPPGARLFDTQWKQLMGDYDYVSQFPEKRAEEYLAQLPRLRKDYAQSPLKTAEMKQILGFAHTLFNGQRKQEAEELFRMVYEQKSNLAPAGEFVDLRANAAFHLANVLISAERKPEAVSLLKEILVIGQDHPIKFVEDGGWHSGSQQSVQTKAMRRLAELREETPVQAALNPTRKVVVKSKDTPSIDLSYDYRVPAGYTPNHNKSYRVLLLCDPKGDSVCRDGDSWARFADTHELFLVVVRHRNPDATLQALAELRKEYPIITDRLLLHGHSNGAKIAHTFALTKPDLCAAVSVHSADWLQWEERLPVDLHPLSDLKQVPYFVTCGENDSATTDTSVYPRVVRFVTMARDAGVPIIWKSLPNTFHHPTSEMETMAQAFFAAVLDEQKQPERFTGDLRTWSFFAADDPQGASIPKNYQVELPSRAFAELWGKPNPQ